MLVYIKEGMVRPNPQEIVVHTVGHITVEPMPQLYCQNEAISYVYCFLFSPLYFELAFTRPALAINVEFLNQNFQLIGKAKQSARCDQSN